LTRSIDEIRQREKGYDRQTGQPGHGLFVEMDARVGRVATQIACIEHNAYSPVFGWRSQEQAWAQTQGQLAWYRTMEETGRMADRDSDG
jgi:membrane dipeptidase